MTTEHAPTAPRFAPLFISHGSPMTALEPGAAGAFWADLGRALAARIEAGQGPRALVLFSAHTLARQPVVLGGARHPAIHDFGGFPQALYDLRYEAPGDPALAARIHTLLQAAGEPAVLSQAAGLDHGNWTPLRTLRPQADLPVVPVAFPPDASPARLMAIGAALAPLVDEGIWVIGSGSITHNLGLGFGQPGQRDAPAIPEAQAFRQWCARHTEAGDWPTLLEWRQRAPHPRLMHPTDEHLLPFFIAAGAAGTGPGRRLHDSITWTHLGMDVYAFGPQAGDWPQALAA